MAFTLLQAGTGLYALNTMGGASPALTLPTGVTLSKVLVPRFARIGNYVVVVNTPSSPISVGFDGVVRLLTPAPPATPITLSNVNGGALSGTFQAKQTFVVLDTDGNIISQSDYGPTSNTVAITTDYLHYANINLSAQQVSASRLYRTTTLGATFFHALDVDGNVNQAVNDDLPDAALPIAAGPLLGTAPDLTLICNYQSRLFGVSRADYDNLRWTETGTMYGWSALNTLPIPAVGDDRFGITALMPRRNALGIGRRNSITQLTGTGTDSYRPVTVKQVPGCGVVSQESCVTVDDAVYFLGLTGVFKWDDAGIACVSDTGNVASWFSSDRFFNRGMFSQAFAIYDVDMNMYRLYLCSVGSIIPDRWVEMDLETGRWFGPHKTDAFTLSCALTVRGTNDQQYPMVGSREGFLSQNTPTRTDWGLVPISVSVLGRPHDGGDPNRMKVFGEMDLHLEKRTVAGNIVITPYIGEQVDALVATDPILADVTLSRQRLPRLGTGTHCQLAITANVAGQKSIIRGYTIPTVDIGER